MLTAMLGPASCLQPLVQLQGSVHRFQVITSLKHFRKSGPVGAVLHNLSEPCPAAASFSRAALSAAAGRQGFFSARKPHQHAAWRCLAAQQLQVVDTSHAGGSAGGRTAARSIQPGEVHLWWLDPEKVGGPVELQRLSQLLSDEELADCSSSGEEAVRRERILARALVRSVLASYLGEGVHPRSLLFGKNSHGKPRLLWPVSTPTGHTLSFNLTHTTSLVGLAVTVGGVVGLDVEGTERRTRRDPMRLAQRRFSQQEIADLQACPDEDTRAAYFLQLWTLKEAYVKALGRGISAPPGLRSFSFRLTRERQQQQKQSQYQQQEQQAQDVSENVSRAANSAAAQQLPLLQHAAVACSSEQQTLLSSSEQYTWLHDLAATLGSSSSTGGRGSIQFASDAAEPRHWQFALIRPDTQHLAALCVELGGGGSNSSGAHGEVQEQQQPQPQQPHHQQEQQQRGKLLEARILSFEAVLSGLERLLEPRLLAQGRHP